MPKKKETTKLKQCPRCKLDTYVVSIFGSICNRCFYDPKAESWPPYKEAKPEDWSKTLKGMEDTHTCPQDETGLCDDCPCHTKSGMEDTSWEDEWESFVESAYTLFFSEVAPKVKSFIVEQKELSYRAAVEYLLKEIEGMKKKVPQEGEFTAPEAINIGSRIGYNQALDTLQAKLRK